MPNETVAISFSFVAMALIVSSYLFEKKLYFLTFQALGTAFLVLSYFFNAKFFAMVGLLVGLFRTVAYFLYEKRAKKPPLWLTLFICALTLFAYFAVNFAIVKTAQPIDVLYLCSLLLYALIFPIKNVRTMRYLVVIPTLMALLYNLLVSAPFFSTLSYAFETCAGVYAIVRFNLCPDERERGGKGKRARNT